MNTTSFAPTRPEYDYVKSLSNDAKSVILTKLLKKEAKRGFARYLYDLIPEIKEIYNKKNEHIQSSNPINIKNSIVSKDMLIVWIASLCNAYQIYQFDYSMDNDGYKIDLYIIIADNEGRNFKELNECIQSIQLQNWNITYSLCQESLFREYIKSGSVFHLNKCTKDHLLYSLKHAPLEIPDLDQIKTLKQDALKRFIKNYEKSQLLLKTSQTYRNKNHNTLACFMMHQSLEILLRSAILCLSSIQLKLHSIRSLLKYCRRFDQKFSTFLDSKNPTDMYIINTLENSYVQARYSNDFHIDNGLIALIASKVTLISEYTYQYTLKAIDGDT